MRPMRRPGERLTAASTAGWRGTRAAGSSSRPRSPSRPASAQAHPGPHARARTDPSPGLEEQRRRPVRRSRRPPGGARDLEPHRRIAAATGVDAQGQTEVQPPHHVNRPLRIGLARCCLARHGCSVRRCVLPARPCNGRPACPRVAGRQCGLRWRRSAPGERPDTCLDCPLVLLGVTPGDSNRADEDTVSLEGHPAGKDDRSPAGHGVVAEELGAGLGDRGRGPRWASGS